MPTLLRSIRLVAISLGWVLGVGLLGVCGLHQAQLLDTSWEVAIIGASPLLLLLAVPVGAAAALTRRWVLAVAMAVVMGCWCIWVVPDFWPIADPGPAGPVVVRLFDANVSQANRNLTDIAGEIRRDTATVVTLEELTPVALRSLQRTGVLTAYPYRMVDAETGAAGMGVWSTAPLDDLHSWQDLDDQEEIEGVLRLAGSPAIHLDVVHVYAPAFGPDEPATWRHQLSAIRAHLAAQPRPLLVAGDFNATWDLRPFQQILRLGLRDAAVIAGDGWQMTWPRDQAWVIPYLRIDHILVSPQLTVRSYRLGDDRGSDHRPLLVGVAFRRR